jgi:hypothetical protein
MTEQQTFALAKTHFEKLSPESLSFFYQYDKGFTALLYLSSDQSFDFAVGVVEGVNPSAVLLWQSIEGFKSRIDQSNGETLDSLSNVATSAIPVIGEILDAISAIGNIVEFVSALSESSDSLNTLKPVIINGRPYQDLGSVISPFILQKNLNNIDRYKNARPKCVAPFSSSCVKEHTNYAKRVQMFVKGLEAYVNFANYFKSLDQLKYLTHTWENNPFTNPLNSSLSASPNSKLALIGLGLLSFFGLKP